MPEVSLFRLHVLRGMYLILVVGLGLFMWPGLIHHRPEWPLMNGVVHSLLGALGLLSLLGLRYPLQMLPLLLLELAWKVIWLAAVAAPLWAAHQLDADTMETVRDCLMGVVLVPLAVPWPYVWARYVAARGDPWGRPRAAAEPGLSLTAR